MVDHGDALALRPRLGRGEIDLGADAREVQLRVGRHLVDDLRDGGAVILLPEQLAATEVLRDDVRGEVSRRLSVGKALEAAVDDGHLDALAGESLLVPRSCERDADLLAAHSGLDLRVWRPHAVDAGLAGQRGLSSWRDERLNEAGSAPLDPPSQSADALPRERRVAASR